MSAALTDVMTEAARVGANCWLHEIVAMRVAMDMRNARHAAALVELYAPLRAKVPGSRSTGADPSIRESASDAAGTTRTRVRFGA